VSDQVEVDGRSVKVTHGDKVLFPDDGITKGDLIAYYRRVAGAMLPHLEGRPLSLQRFPDGIDREGFFQRRRRTTSPAGCGAPASPAVAAAPSTTSSATTPPPPEHTKRPAGSRTRAFAVGSVRASRPPRASYPRSPSADGSMEMVGHPTGGPPIICRVESPRAIASFSTDPAVVKGGALDTSIL